MKYNYFIVIILIISNISTTKNAKINLIQSKQQYFNTLRKFPLYFVIFQKYQNCKSCLKASQKFIEAYSSDQLLQLYDLQIYKVYTDQIKFFKGQLDENTSMKIFFKTKDQFHQIYVLQNNEKKQHKKKALNAVKIAKKKLDKISFKLKNLDRILNVKNYIVVYLGKQNQNFANYQKQSLKFNSKFFFTFDDFLIHKIHQFYQIENLQFDKVFIFRSKNYVEKNNKKEISKFQFDQEKSLKLFFDQNIYPDILKDRYIKQVKDYIHQKNKMVLIYLQSSPQNESKILLFRTAAKKIKNILKEKVIFAQLKNNEDFKLELEEILQQNENKIQSENLYGITLQKNKIKVQEMHEDFQLNNLLKFIIDFFQQNKLELSQQQKIQLEKLLIFRTDEFQLIKFIQI